MVIVEYKPKFKEIIKKIKDNSFKEKIKKQILKIKNNPEIGKPMKYVRKGTRELYIKPFRVSYAYLRNEDKVIFLNLYHKNKQ